MSLVRVLFLHGLESRPNGHKYQALHKANFDVHAPDLSNKSLFERVEVATKEVARWTMPYYVVGSSFGGITAIFMAQLAGNSPKGMVLCAPALRHTEARNHPIGDMGVPCPVAIIHGIDDDTCQIDHSRTYAKIHGAGLVEVDDGHRLLKSDQIIITTLKEMIRKTL